VFVEGELGAEDRRQLESHLTGCPDCRRLVDCLQRAETGLAAFPELEVSPALLERLRAIPRVEQKKAKSEIRTEGRLGFLRLRPSLQPILAGAFLLLVFASAMVFTPAGGRLLKTLDRQFHLGYNQVEKLYAGVERLADSLNSKKEEIIVAIKSASPLSRDENE
jgi:anti-sigma factor RsiW